MAKKGMLASVIDKFSGTPAVPAQDVEKATVRSDVEERVINIERQMSALCRLNGVSFKPDGDRLIAVR